MQYHEFAPPEVLRRYVRCLWTLSDAHAGDRGMTPVEPILPDGCMELVVHFGDRFARVRATGAAEIQSRAFFVGQIRSPFVVVPTGAIGVVAARFRIGGASAWLRGSSASALVESEVSVDDLWPGHADELQERVAESHDARSRTLVLAEWLIARMCPRDAHPAVAAAADWFEERRFACGVAALASDLSMSPRHVERLFADHVGLGPKLVARILRFQELLAAARSTPGAPWTDLAARSGYADQAHAIRDFREFAGTTPTAWVAAHTPIAAALAGFES